MSEEIRKLEPQNVWENFYQLTQIPRPSKHEKAAVEYVKKVGNSLGYTTIVDEVGNVIIRKPATPGMENRKGVILQAHLDMVPQANSHVQHDFTKDPIQAYIDGEWVKAKDTTLGADNGMGVAAALAILQSKNVKHGPLEVLLTVDEETGMTGAFNLKPGLLQGEILINLDSEDEGELYVGCAGGEDATAIFTIETEPTPSNYKSMQIAVKGLKGGHSGMDINLGRGNANKIIFRLLREFVDTFSVRLIHINGGNMRNAIPREAFATISYPANEEEAIKAHIMKYLSIIRSELKATEPDLTIEILTADPVTTVYTKDFQNRLINSILACPNGVCRMSDEMPGLVETSNNLAIVKSIEGQVHVQCLMRSSVDTARKALAMRIKAVFDLAKADVRFTGGYPGWKPNMNSPILKTMISTYQKLYGKNPEIKAIHAGLECGILGGIYPTWDMISCGPTIRSPHSPDERVKIDTVKKFFDFLVATLENIPAK